MTDATTTAVPDRERQMLMSKRQALIIELGGLEDYLGMPRSIVPRRKREQPEPDELVRKFDRLTADRKV